MNAVTVKMAARCTTCNKLYAMTEQQQDEAREMGCAFSPCCHAVAVVERAEIGNRVLKRGADPVPLPNRPGETIGSYRKRLAAWSKP